MPRDCAGLTGSRSLFVKRGERDCAGLTGSGSLSVKRGEAVSSLSRGCMCGRSMLRRRPRQRAQAQSACAPGQAAEGGRRLRRHAQGRAGVGLPRPAHRCASRACSTACFTHACLRPQHTPWAPCPLLLHHLCCTWVQVTSGARKLRSLPMRPAKQHSRAGTAPDACGAHACDHDVCCCWCPPGLAPPDGPTRHIVVDHALTTLMHVTVMSAAAGVPQAWRPRTGPRGTSWWTTRSGCWATRCSACCCACPSSRARPGARESSSAVEAGNKMTDAPHGCGPAARTEACRSSMAQVLCGAAQCAAGHARAGLKPGRTRVLGTRVRDRVSVSAEGLRQACAGPDSGWLRMSLLPCFLGRQARGRQ